jgi:hypothetical protein
MMLVAIRSIPVNCVLLGLILTSERISQMETRGLTPSLCMRAWQPSSSAGKMPARPSALRTTVREGRLSKQTLWGQTGLKSNGYSVFGDLQS